MSQTSDWPLANKSVRLVSPVVIRRKLENHPLSSDCFPLAIGYYECAIEHRMSRRRHDDNILIYCFAGKGHLQTADWEGAINAGELIILPSGVGHRYAADKTDPWSIYWCHFSGQLAARHIAHIVGDRHRPVIPIGHSPAIIAQFQTLLQATGKGYALTAMVHASNMLKQLLTSIALIIEEQTESTKTRFELAGIQRFMLQNLDKDIDLGMLADQVKLSRYHFSKKYKQATGYAPMHHLTKMRMEYAMYLIETSDTPIGEVAHKVGYEDALYFSRRFKQIIGLSPAQYRKARA